MNVPMQPPLRYPLYMDRPPLPMAMSWSTLPRRLPPRPQYALRPAYPMPSFVFSQANEPLARPVPPASPYTNMRYQHLKKSTSHPNRRALTRSIDAPARSMRPTEQILTEPYRPSRAKSISEIADPIRYSASSLSKAHSWHAMNNHRRANLSVAYAEDLKLSPKRQRKQSPHKKNRLPPLQRRLSTSSSFRKRPPPALDYPRKRPVDVPERGPIRISTLDEMPVNNAPITKQNRSISHDRLSTKRSVSTSSLHRPKSKGTGSLKSRKAPSNTTNDADDVSSGNEAPGSIRSRSSLQQHLNGSLRNDPLISAAIDELRQFRRASSQNLSTITSLDRRSDTRRPKPAARPRSSSSSSSSPSTSRSHSQSSFTSLERSEIRQLMKTIKTKDVRPIANSLPSSASEQSISFSTEQSAPKSKPQKSCVAEELDREFNKLRALNPSRDISYVVPSTICKRKKTLEKPAPNLPPLPTFDELLRQVQLRPVDKTPRPLLPVEQRQPVEDIYENPLSPIPVPVPVPASISSPLSLPIAISAPVPIPASPPTTYVHVPVPVPQGSPTPSLDIKVDEPKHEYALPIKKTDERSVPRISHFQPMRGSRFSDKRPARPLSMFNWFHNTPTNPPLTTFQPNRVLSLPSECGTSSAKENIYTAEIEAYVPISTLDKNDEDPLQMHLDNQTIVTDDLYGDYETKPAANSASILDDFSHLFARKHKHHHGLSKKHQRCSIM